MFVPTPNTWLDNWSENGTLITLPIASLPELTADEADGTTGDIRKVVYALLAKLHAEYDERASADRPAKMVIGKSSSFNQATGQITVNYQVTLVLGVSGLEVAAE